MTTTFVGNLNSLYSIVKDRVVRIKGLISESFKLDLIKFKLFESADCSAS